jgi:hypothetical protein
MASEVFRKALELSGSGFNQILGTVQKQAERIERNAALAEQMKQRKEFARFQSDLNLETLEERARQAQNIKKEYYDENLEQAVEQAEAIGKAENRLAIDRQRKINELGSEGQQAKAVRERIKDINTEVDTKNEEAREMFAPLQDKGLIGVLPTARKKIITDEEGNFVGYKSVISIYIDGEVKEFDNLNDLRSVYSRQFKISDMVEEIDEQLKSSQISDTSVEADGGLIYGKRDLRQVKNILTDPNVSWEQKTKAYNNYKYSDLNYDKEESNLREFEQNGFDAWSNISSVLGTIRIEIEELGLWQKVGLGTRGLGTNPYDIFNSVLTDYSGEQPLISTHNKSVAELTNILANVASNNTEAVKQEYIDSNTSLPNSLTELTELTELQISRGTTLLSGLEELKENWVQHQNKSVNWNNYTLNPQAYTNDVKFENMFLKIEEVSEKKKTDIEEAEQNVNGMGEDNIYAVPADSLKKK